MGFSYISDSLEVFDLRKTEIDLSTIGNRRFMYHPYKFGCAERFGTADAVRFGSLL